MPCSVTTAVCWKQHCGRRADGSSDSSHTAFYKSSMNYYYEVLFGISELSVSAYLLSVFS